MHTSVCGCDAPGGAILADASVQAKFLGGIDVGMHSIVLFRRAFIGASIWGGNAGDVVCWGTKNRAILFVFVPLSKKRCSRPRPISLLIWRRPTWELIQ